MIIFIFIWFHKVKLSWTSESFDDVESDNIDEDDPDGSLQHVLRELREGEDRGRLFKISKISHLDI